MSEKTSSSSSSSAPGYSKADEAKDEKAMKEVESIEEKADGVGSDADKGSDEKGADKSASQSAREETSAVKSAPDNAPAAPPPPSRPGNSDVDHVTAAELRQYRRGRADGLVGLFTLVALLLGFAAYCWWKSYSPLNPPQRFNVSFHDVASLNYQAAVYVDGVRVGSVDKIQIKGSENVLVGMKVNTQKIAIPEGSRFIILPNGVVGAKYIEIILPEKAQEKKLPLLTEKSVVQGDDPIRPEIVVNELVERLSTIDFSQLQSKLSMSMDKIGNVADHVSTLSTKMEPVADRAKVTAASVSALADEMREPVQQMHQILDQKHPLMHMIFGRPGHVKESKETKETVKKSDGSTVEVKDSKQTKVKVDPNKSDNGDDNDDDKKKKHHKFFHL